MPRVTAVSAKPDSFDRHVLPNRSQLVSAGAHCPPVRTAAHPLETFTDPSSTRSHQRYDWKTGEMNTVHDTILGNARTHMSRLKTRTVTSSPTHPDQTGDMYCGYAGLAAPAPPLTANKSSAKKKKPSR